MAIRRLLFHGIQKENTFTISKIRSVLGGQNGTLFTRGCKFRDRSNKYQLKNSKYGYK